MSPPLKVQAVVVVEQAVDEADDKDVSDAQVKVLFLPSGKRGEFPKHSRLLDAARTLGVDIDSVCGGRGL